MHFYPQFPNTDYNRIQYKVEAEIKLMVPDKSIEIVDQRNIRLAAFLTIQNLRETI